MLSLAPSFTADTDRVGHREMQSTPAHAGGPDWDVGDSWTYQVSPIHISQETADRQIDVAIRPEDIAFEVVDATDGSYRVTADCRLQGECEVAIESAQVLVTGQLSRLIPTRIHSETWRQQANLAVESHALECTGIVRVMIAENPFVPLPLPPLFIPLTVSLDADLAESLPVLQFPMDVGQTWSIPDTMLTLDGFIESIWLKTANLAITVVNTILAWMEMEQLPPELTDLLPTIDLQDLLAMMGYDSTLDLPRLEHAFACLSRETVTVPAGTYETFKVLVLGGVATLYYAPEAERVVRSDVDGEKLSLLTGGTVQLSDIEIMLASEG